MPYKPRRFRKRHYRKAKSAPRMSFDKRVLSILNKQRELKVAVHSGDFPIQASIQDFSVLRVMPEILQSGNVGASAASQEFQRDGNQVNIKKVVVRWWLTQKQTADVALSRVVVRHMILRQRGISGGAIVNDTTLFKSGQLLENAQPFVGNINSLQLPVNKAAFVSRMDKRHYLSTPTINQAQLDVDADQINNFKMGQKTLTFGKGKTITWGTGGASDSNNFPYFMVLGGATVDGNFIDGVTFNYTSTVYFHDS